LVSAAAGFCAPSHAAELLILASSGGEFVRDCSNRDVVISGSNSKFILAGGCQSLTVPGDGNQILADMADESEILLRGNENSVAWTNMMGGDQLKIHTEGRLNHIVKLDDATKQPNRGETTKPPAKPQMSANEPKPDSGQSRQSGQAAPSPPAPVPVAGTSGSSGSAAEVHFAFDSARLQSDALHILIDNAVRLRESNQKNVRLIGHTDSIGGHAYNINLSVRRADAVKNWLIREGGLAQEGLTSVGLGPDQPKARNSTAAGRSENRRVEIVTETSPLRQADSK
jgi:outer membrane protein OmpA-like peptidoglycan-associated protein